MGFRAQRRCRLQQDLTRLAKQQPSTCKYPCRLGSRLYGPDKNEKYYYSGPGITLYTSDGVLVSGPVVPDETGAATIVSNALAAGNNTFYAVYSGNNYVLPSQSSTVTLLAGSTSSTVATTTTLSASSTVVQAIPFSVTLTAHVVQASGTAIPEGTVTISAQGVPVNTVSIDSTGSATFDYTLASEGVNAITATYNGSGNFAASTSAAVNITVGTASATSDFRIEGPSSITVSANANTAISLQIIPVNGFQSDHSVKLLGAPCWRILQLACKRDAILCNGNHVDDCIHKRGNPGGVARLPPAALCCSSKTETNCRIDADCSHSPDFGLCRQDYDLELFATNVSDLSGYDCGNVWVDHPPVCCKRDLKPVMAAFRAGRLRVETDLGIQHTSLESICKSPFALGE